MNEQLAFGELLLARKKSKLPFIVMYAVIVILVLLILFYYFFGCAIVKGQSMENTLDNSQRCLLLKRNYTIEHGDIITLKHPDSKEDGDMLIKRAIALGGDKILFVRSQGNKYVDMYVCKSGESHFKLSKEKYLKEEHMTYGGTDSKFGFDANGFVVPTTAYRPQEEIEKINFNAEQLDYDAILILDSVIEVPKNYVYYMGDNRNHSTDSRYYGPCKVSDITGKVINIIEKGSALEGFLNFMFSMY